MKILAIDTATERCSVALRSDAQCVERAVDTARGHADLVLPMVQEVLRESGLALRDLDGIAYGRGPGAFTGVRIAIGVVQGLAFGAELPTIGISNLAAVAQQVAGQTAGAGARILVCMDARMSEVYWGVFSVGKDRLVNATGGEQVSRPEGVSAPSVAVLAGTGFKAYPELREWNTDAAVYEDVLPHARDIALLGEAALQCGQGQAAIHAQPVYLRNRVTFVKPV